MAVKVIPINLIGSELNSAVEQLQANIQSYISNPSLLETFQACTELTNQLRGVCGVVLFTGAEELFKELHAIFKKGAQTQGHNHNQILTLSVKVMTVLKQYLAFLESKEADVPELLLPIVNELRAVNKKQPLTESGFFKANIETLPNALAGATFASDVTPATIRRMRHMYQVGLTNIIRDENIQASARMMLRSVEHIQRYSGDCAFAYFWWVVQGVLQAISDGSLHINRRRKMLLGQLDRQFKAAEQDWAATSDGEIPSTLLNDLLFLITIVEHDTEVTQKIKAAFGLHAAVLNDSQLTKQQTVLMVGNKDITAIIEKTKADISGIKEKLAAVVAGTYPFANVIDSIEAIASGLLDAALDEPAKVLNNNIEKMKAWQSQGATPSKDDLLHITDAVLYAESALNMMSADLAEGAGTESTDQASANTLQDSQRTVLTEAQMGVIEAIHQASTYVESDYDKSALADINKHLKTASNGLLFMKLERAAKIADGCTKFFDEKVINATVKPTLQQLDAIADALTALEYYLGGLLENKRYGESMLDVAEEGLKTLGYL